MTKTELFIKLAAPDENGKSREVLVSEFVGEYANLQLGNGGSWCRKSSTLAKKYHIRIITNITKGNSIDAIQLTGFKTEESFNQTIRKDIREYYKNQRCVMLGVVGFSENTKIEIDHKDGRKEDWRVSNPATQRLDDFQPLCKAANDVKRQICKECKKTGHRWDARNIKGNPYSFYAGSEIYTEDSGCVGCYQYDPVAYRQHCVARIAKDASEHTADYIMRKLYPTE